MRNLSASLSPSPLLLAFRLSPYAVIPNAAGRFSLLPSLPVKVGLRREESLRRLSLASPRPPFASPLPSLSRNHLNSNRLRTLSPNPRTFSRAVIPNPFAPLRTCEGPAFRFPPSFRTRRTLAV
jgi:hypothetical protein